MRYMKIIALLLAGSFFLGGCSGGCVRRGVKVNGIEVGGMTYAEAAEKIRKELGRLPLVVTCPNGDFAASLDYADGLEETLKNAKRNASLSVILRREWVDMERDLLKLCEQNAREGVDAELSFTAEGFVYTPEINAVSCDYEKLLKDVQTALKSGGTQVFLECRDAPPAVTAELLKERTQPLAEFTTFFDGENLSRAHNIALAASRISGTVIGPDGEFSFNERVGKRTEENGFRIAAVIQDGEFVQGVGGGVCQASTTLFGAALRAGLTIEESHPHSLSVGYVRPSQDAMVSEYSDLRVKNPYPYPVYLLAKAEKGAVTFSFFGLPDGKAYKVESRVLREIEPPPEEIVEGTVNRTLRAAKKGLASESFLVVCDKEGKELSRTLIRRDTYAPVRGIEERVPAPLVPEISEEGQEEEPENGGEIPKEWEEEIADEENF